MSSHAKADFIPSTNVKKDVYAEAQGWIYCMDQISPFQCYNDTLTGRCKKRAER
jgi:hypothetical protein